jgi:hypothetical protein
MKTCLTGRNTLAYLFCFTKYHQPCLPHQTPVKVEESLYNYLPIWDLLVSDKHTNLFSCIASTKRFVAHTPLYVWNSGVPCCATVHFYCYLPISDLPVSDKHNSLFPLLASTKSFIANTSWYVWSYGIPYCASVHFYYFRPIPDLPVSWKTH